MWVADSRLEKYLEAGHVLASKASPVIPTDPEPVQPVSEDVQEEVKPVKRSVRKTIRKR